MPNWLERARHDLAKQPAQGTAKTAETYVLSVLAVAAIDGCDKKAWLKRWLDVRRILTVKRGFDDATASSEASRWLIVEWLNQYHQEQPDTTICGHCSQPFTNRNGNPGLPFLNGGGGHVWVHRNCHSRWIAAREARAKATLQTYGIAFD